MTNEPKMCPGPPGPETCPEGAPSLPWQAYCKACGNAVRREAARRRYRKQRDALGLPVYGVVEREADLQLQAEMAQKDDEFAWLKEPRTLPPKDV
jgi:hypothetical protein